MSLKQSIVIANQYTVKTGSGRGSRGSTPGDYITQYMARKGAVETCAPVRKHDMDDYITLYMAREDATEQAKDIPELKKKLRNTSRYGGVAFGYGQVSMSDEAIVAASKDIQGMFDEGKTVMKTVLSFTPEYLKEQGLVPKNFECKEAGDYRGNLDQMRLRMAVMSGLDRMAKQSGFDDLRYVGVIQVDTEHVHVHLAMADAGRGRVVSTNGQQRGLITTSMKKQLRYGLDNYLDQSNRVRQMVSSVDRERRNAKCFVKKFTQMTMEQEGGPQFLLACLPDDKRLWRAASKSESMQKANYIAREYVNEILAQPGSGYEDALRSIERYARSRQRREGLSNTDTRRLYQNGQKRLVDECVNSVYQVLGQLPEQERQTRTPMMTAMVQDYERMAFDAQDTQDPMIEFGFRLRSYATRLNYHKKATSQYHDAVKRLDTDDVDETARPLIDFLKFEEEYNAKLMSKYQHFLGFLPPQDTHENEFQELVKYKRKMTRLELMKGDKSMRQMLPENAEKFGMRTYGMTGGRFVPGLSSVLDARLEKMQDKFDQMRSDFAGKLAADGMSLQTDEHTGVLSVQKKPVYEFDDVKALDIHHLGMDFAHDLPISVRNIQIYLDAAQQRSELYQKAAEYLTATGQDGFLAALPGRDVKLMSDVAERLKKVGVLEVAKPKPGDRKSGRTVRLDRQVKQDIDLAIHMSVQTTVQYQSELE